MIPGYCSDGKHGEIKVHQCEAGGWERCCQLILPQFCQLLRPCSECPMWIAEQEDVDG